MTKRNWASFPKLSKDKDTSSERYFKHLDGNRKSIELLPKDQNKQADVP